MKRINIEGDVKSRRRISEAWAVREVIKKEVVNAKSEEVPEYPVIQTDIEPQEKKKGRRKAAGDV